MEPLGAVPTGRLEREPGGQGAGSDGAQDGERKLGGEKELPEGESRRK